MYGNDKGYPCMIVEQTRIIVATTGDRPTLLFACLNSLYKLMPEYKVVVVAQETPDIVKKNLLTLQKIRKEWGLEFVWHDKKSGPHSAKVSVLEKYPDTELWVSMDDDMEVIKETNYKTALEKALESKVGIISCNWVRTESLIAKRDNKDKFVSQKLIYTGGGFVFSKKIAKLVLQLPNRPYSFDDCLWAGVAYSEGYTNYRYLGSLCIHRVCSKGGRQSFLMKAESALPPDGYVIMTPCKKQMYPYKTANYYMPKPNEVHPDAEANHIRNKKG